MSNTIRCSLPGYNALDETNIDNFSLYADEDNILIKEFTSGNSGTVTEPGGLWKSTVNHGLGYIPLCFPYFKGTFYAGDMWSVAHNGYNEFEFPQLISAVDTQNLYFISDSAKEIYYRIFYDDMSETGNPEIVEDNMVVKVARPNKSAESHNPNDFIMHSSLNNLKILHQETKTVTLNSTTTIAHGADVSSAVQAIIFVKFPDGKTTMPGSLDSHIVSYDGSKEIFYIAFDETNIKMDILGQSPFDVDITYFFFGKGKDNTLNDSSAVIAVGSEGKNVLTSTNPDDFNFHSTYPTLKYFSSGTYDMGSVSNTTTYTVNHGLGYTPFFAGYVEDLHQLSTYNGNTEPVYALTPYYFSRSIAPFLPDRDVMAAVYADNDNIYLKAYFESNAIGTSFPVNNFHWKIFKNNLNIT